MAGAAPALLLVPVLLTTVALLTPAPWGVPEAQRGPVLVASIVGWVVLPFAVGAWHRRWWWPLLCLITVLVTVGLITNAGRVVIGGYGEYGHGAPPVTVAVWRPGLALGALAALAAAAGVVLAPAIARLERRVRHGLITAGLVAGIVPVVIAWVVVLGTGSDCDSAIGSGLGSGLVSLVALATLLVTTTYGPYQAGLWIGPWGWLFAGGWVLACGLVPAALILYWGPPYLDAVPSCSPTGYTAVLVLVLGGVIFTAITVAWAGIGVVRGRSRKSERP